MVKTNRRWGRGARVWLSFGVLIDGAFFDGCDVQTGNCDAAVVIEPDYDTCAAGVDARVIGAWNRVAAAAGCHDREGLDRR